MFANIAVIILIGTVVALGVHLLVAAGRRSGPSVERPRFGVLSKIVYAVLLICTAVLGVTSLYSVIPAGHMEGWLLWAHLGAAGGFVVVLAAAAVMWAEASRFGPARSPEPRGHSEHPDREAAAPRFARLTRISFWVLLLAGTITLATMLLGMTSALGTEQIRTMIDIHRYSGLAVVVAAAVHFYSVCLTRPSRG